MSFQKERHRITQYIWYNAGGRWCEATRRPPQVGIEDFHEMFSNAATAGAAVHFCHSLSSGRRHGGDFWGSILEVGCTNNFRQQLCCSNNWTLLLQGCSAKAALTRLSAADGHAAQHAGRRHLARAVPLQLRDDEPAHGAPLAILTPKNCCWGPRNIQ